MLMLMLMLRNSLLSSIVITIIISSLQSTDCRYHYHKPGTCRKDHNHQDTINYISLPPLSSPSRSPCLPSFHLSPLPSPSPSPYYERTLANSTLEDSSPPLPSSIIPTLPPSYLISPSPSPSPSLSPLLAPSYSNYNSSNSNISCDSNPPLSSPSPLPSTSPIISPLHSPSNSPLSSPALSSLPSPSYDNSTSKNPNNSSTPIVLYPPIPSPSCENSTSNNTTIIESPNNPSTPIMFHPPSPSPSLPSPSYYNSSSNNSTFTSPSPSPAISNDNSNPPSPSPSPSPSSNNVTSKNPNISPTPMIFNPPLPSPSLPSPISNDSATPNPSNGSLITPTIFNIKSFGAIGNGSFDDTKAMRSAWKSACVAENAILLIPADGVFMVTSTIFTGSCRPGFVLQIDGVLMPPDGPDCWPETDSRKQWLVFYRANNMTLRGEGTIEGNGENWWNLPCKPHRGPNGSTLPGPCDSPVLIRFFMSNNVTVEGLRIINSPQFHIKFDVCNGVLISKMWINSPSFSPNTDGIHIENTKSVQIYNSRINNGDDCISIGAGCADVHIENVTCGLGHGISIGSLGAQNSLACVSNITVQNTRIHDSDNGVRIKTWQGGTGSVSGIIFDTIVMENVRNCINIDQYYCTNKQCKNQTLAIYVSDVSYSNIKGTYNIKSPPVHFACSDSMPCSNITLSEVELLPNEGETIMGPFCWNAYGNLATLTIPPIYCLQEGRPQSLQENLNTGC